jgi:rhomboid protease GluP
MWGFAPLVRRLGNDLGFVPLVIGGCTALYVISLLLSGPAALRASGIGDILAPSTRVLFLLGASGALPVFELNRWWTIISAGWLHGSLLHILFNMMWVRQLAPAIADMYGAGRMVLIYTIAGATGFLVSSLAGYWFITSPIPLLRGAEFTIGASASIFGLLGALVHYGRRSVSSAMTSQALTYAIVLFVFGLIMPGVDNFAHAGGFLGGYVASAWLNPMRPERIDHLVGAMICIGLVVVSVIASVVLGLPYVR